MCGGVECVPVCKNMTVDSEKYSLSVDISSNGTCMGILADNAVLDCRGHNISYGINGFGYGVYINGSNVSVRNCNINNGV